MVTIAFAAVRVAYWATGGGFSTTALANSWQLLDLDQLVAHPFQSVTLLHIQPPLFNLFVGGVLRWSPLPHALTFQLAYLACGLVMVLALRALLIELGFTPGAATAGAVAIACDPALLSYENAVTYEVPVATLLVVSSLLCARYVRTRRRAPLAGFLAATTLIVLTRALLHPVWLALCVVVILACARPQFSRRRVIAMVAVPLVIVGGWALKNQILFDEPSLSSWLGMNLARGVIAPMPRHDTDALIRAGKLTPAARVPAFSPYSAYAPTVGPCRTHWTEPVVRSLTKRNGESNFNAVCYLRVYQDAQHNALTAIEERPGAYLRGRGASTAAHFMFELGPGLEPFRENSVLRGLKDLYDVPMLAVHMTINDRDWTNPLIPGAPPPSIPMSLTLLFATALVLARAVLAAYRLARRRQHICDLTWLYLGFTVAFVTAVSIATEYGENSRFRFLTDPIVIGVLVASVARVVTAPFAVRARDDVDPNHASTTKTT